MERTTQDGLYRDKVPRVRGTLPLWDDIVVCPECGAPYHRACYQEKGQCIFEELHKAGKAWEPPAPPKAPDPSAEIKDRECLCAAP